MIVSQSELSGRFAQSRVFAQHNRNTAVLHYNKKLLDVLLSTKITEKLCKCIQLKRVAVIRVADCTSANHYDHCYCCFFYFLSFNPQNCFYKKFKINFHPKRS